MLPLWRKRTSPVYTALPIVNGNVRTIRPFSRTGLIALVCLASLVILGYSRLQDSYAYVFSDPLGRPHSPSSEDVSAPNSSTVGDGKYVPLPLEDDLSPPGQNEELEKPKPKPEWDVPANPAVHTAPLYNEFRTEENELPQHNPELPLPEGKDARFLKFSNQMMGVGLNNQMQEIIVYTHIALASRRSYVFTPIIYDGWTWDPYVEVPSGNANFVGAAKYMPSNLPLRAFFTSPTSGEPWPEELGIADHVPRAVNDQYFQQVCPDERKFHVNSTAVNLEMGIDTYKVEGATVVEKWAEYLDRLDEKCVVIEGTRIVDFALFAEKRVSSLWPILSKSPVYTHFKWSDRVYGAVERNIKKFQFSQAFLTGAKSIRSRVGSTALFGSFLGRRTGQVEGEVEEKRAAIGFKADERLVPRIIDDTISLHIRRKDFQWHCDWISSFGNFNGWNQLPFLPDQFQPPYPPTRPSPLSNPDLAWPETEESKKLHEHESTARLDYVRSRCFIDVDPVVAKLHKIRAEKGNEGLKRVYISTNAEEGWLDTLKDALEEDGWERNKIVGTDDLELEWQKEGGLDPAIDMELLSRARVFVGNGFSSFTSTVVRLRLVRGFDPSSIRFW